MAFSADMVAKQAATGLTALLIEREQVARRYRDAFDARARAFIAYTEARDALGDPRLFGGLSSMDWARYGEAEHAYRMADDEVGNVDAERQGIKAAILDAALALGFGLVEMTDDDLARLAVEHERPGASSDLVTAEHIAMHGDGSALGRGRRWGDPLPAPRRRRRN